jgi:hypothetical protein
LTLIADYELAWKFIATVRNAAANAAAAEADALDAAGTPTSFPTHLIALMLFPGKGAIAGPWMQRVPFLRSSQTDGSNDLDSAEGNSRSSASSASSDGVRQRRRASLSSPSSKRVNATAPASDQTEASGGLESSISIRARRHKRLPPPPSLLRTAIDEATKAAKCGGGTAATPLPVETCADFLFTLAHLPAVVTAVRATFSTDELVRIRHAVSINDVHLNDVVLSRRPSQINRLSLPILRAFETLFWRPAPSKAQLKSEMHNLDLNSSSYPKPALPEDEDWEQQYLRE